MIFEIIKPLNKVNNVKKVKSCENVLTMPDKLPSVIDRSFIFAYRWSDAIVLKRALW